MSALMVSCRTRSRKKTLCLCVKVASLPLFPLPLPLLPLPLPFAFAFAIAFVFCLCLSLSLCLYLCLLPLSEPPLPLRCCGCSLFCFFFSPKETEQRTLLFHHPNLLHFYPKPANRTRRKRGQKAIALFLHFSIHTLSPFTLSPFTLSFAQFSFTFSLLFTSHTLNTYASTNRQQQYPRTRHSIIMESYMARYHRLFAINNLLSPYHLLPTPWLTQPLVS